MSEMTGIQPTMDITGGNSGWGGNGWGSLIGGAIGGAVGAGWGNRGGWGGAVAPVAPCCHNNNDQFVMDTLTTMRTDINSIGRDNLMQTANLQSALCSGFAGVNAGVAGVGADLARGQSRTEAAVYTTGLQGQISSKDNLISNLTASHANEVQAMRNTFDLMTAQKDCCCTTNRNIESQGCQTRQLMQSEGCSTRTAIHAEGEATRALISQLDRERLLRESAAKDAKIAQLEAQGFNAGLAMQQQSTLTGMSAVLADILRRVSA